MATAYPLPPTSDTTYQLHGVTVPDPYRPLEDPDDPATVAWVGAENALTERFLSAVESRPAIRDRIESMWDYPKVGVPMERAGRWFQLRNTGLQNQSVLCASDSPGGEGFVVIDPNLLSEDGTVSLTSLAVSEDGLKVAYALSEAGSDWRTWRVHDVARGGDDPDVLEWSKFTGAAWTHDGLGFFYGSVEPPLPGAELTGETRSPRICYHRLGTDQGEDRVEFSAPEHPDWFPAAEVTSDGRYLVVTVTRGTGTETALLIRDLHDPQGELVELTSGFEAQDLVVASTPEGFLVLTDRSAPQGRLVMCRRDSSGAAWAEPSEWEEILAPVPETLTEANLYGGRLVCHYLHHARAVVRVHELSGKMVREVELPGMVSLVPGLSGRLLEGRADDATVLYQVVSFVQSGAVWTHDLDTAATQLVSASAARFDSDRFVTEQVFVTSADGTRVPMFLTRGREQRPDGTARVLLYGYGGFSVPLAPTFSVTFAAWLDRGGVLAVANLRGGGEYGKPWHDAGRLERKQNVFDDFAACARWLAGSGWSTPRRIAISGGSNGGLLVGASITQHPELFGAAVAEVAVLDMLRFHLFTIGWAWKSDYGDPGDPEQFECLRAYSPLHNLHPGTCYPPTLIMTGDHDDRVVPAHSYKFAAALQAAQGCDRPTLLRVSTSAGHGLGKPTAKLIDEAADRLAFLEAALGG